MRSLGTIASSLSGLGPPSAASRDGFEQARRKTCCRQEAFEDNNGISIALPRALPGNQPAEGLVFHAYLQWSTKSLRK